MSLFNLNLPFLVLIRFQHNDALAYHNSVIRQKPVLKTTFGALPLLTISRLELIEEIGKKSEFTIPRQRYGLGIIAFPSIVKIRDWLEMSYEVRQREWLFPVDIVIVPSRWRIKNIDENTIVEVLEVVKYRNPSRFSSECLDKIDSTNENNIVAVPRYATEVLRGNWNPLYIIINVWSSDTEYNSNSLFALNDISDLVVGYSYIGHCY